MKLSNRLNLANLKKIISLKKEYLITENEARKQEIKEIVNDYIENVINKRDNYFHFLYNLNRENMIPDEDIKYLM